MKVCKQQAAAAAAQLESSLASSKQEQQQHSWLMKWMKQFKTNIYDYFDLKKKVPAVVKINHQQHARDEPISEHTQLYNRHTTYININSTANKHPNCCWDLLRSSQALAFNSNVASKNDFFSLSHIISDQISQHQSPSYVAAVFFFSTFVARYLTRHPTELLFSCITPHSEQKKIRNPKWKLNKNPIYIYQPAHRIDSCLQAVQYS